MTSVLSELTGMVTNGPTMPSLIENFVAAAKNPSKERLVGFDGWFEAQHTTHGKAAGNTVLLQVTGLRYPGDTPSCKVLVRGNVVGKKSRGVLCQAVVEYDLACNPQGVTPEFVVGTIASEFGGFSFYVKIIHTASQ